jgi:uncharacterized protein YlxW (UPF0749 family)
MTKLLPIAGLICLIPYFALAQQDALQAQYEYQERMNAQAQRDYERQQYEQQRYEQERQEQEYQRQQYQNQVNSYGR